MLWVRISKKGEKCNICVRDNSESLGNQDFVLTVPTFSPPFVRVKGDFRILFFRAKSFTHPKKKMPLLFLIYAVYYSKLLTNVFKRQKNFIVTPPNRLKLKLPKNPRHNWVRTV